MLLFFPTYPTVPLSGLLLFLLVILAKVQFFTLKVCSKNWSSNYSSLLNSSNLLTLSSCRTQAKLILTFKFLNNLHYFPPSIFSFVNPTSRHSHHFDPLNISVPFSRSSASFHTFVPSASRTLSLTLPKLVPLFITLKTNLKI